MKKKIGKYYIENCPTCGKEKKVKARSVNPKPRDCGSCATRKSHKDNPRVGRAENHYNWKGGINRTKDG